LDEITAANDIAQNTSIESKRAKRENTATAQGKRQLTQPRKPEASSKQARKARENRYRSRQIGSSRNPKNKQETKQDCAH
jgi:hypothetical protein